MSYEIEIGPKAKKFFKKLPKEVALRFTKKFYHLKTTPFRYLEHFEGGGYKFRIGDYRALIDVDFGRKVLIVRILDKRGRIYKKHR